MRLVRNSSSRIWTRYPNDVREATRRRRASASSGSAAERARIARVAVPRGSPGASDVSSVGGAALAVAVRNALLALLIVSCARSGDAPGVVVRDSTGVTIVESGFAAWDHEPPWRVSAEPTLVIGDADNDEDNQLHEVAGVVRLRDGGVVVADGGSASSLFYDAGGRFLHRVGGRGSGPGEFRRISSLQRLEGDSLLVFDGALARVTMLDAGGALVAVHRIGDTAGEPVRTTRPGSGTCSSARVACWDRSRCHASSILSSSEPTS